MQSTHFDGFLVIAFFDDVRVRYYGFKPEGFFEFFWCNRLDAGVDDWEKQRSFYCAAFSFQFAYSSQQIFFFYFEAQV